MTNEKGSFVGCCGGSAPRSLGGSSLGSGTTGTTPPTDELNGGTMGTADTSVIVDTTGNNAVIVDTTGEPATSPFSPDGELLVALIDKTHVLTAVAFSPDGELLA